MSLYSKMLWKPLRQIHKFFKGIGKVVHNFIVSFFFESINTSWESDEKQDIKTQSNASSLWTQVVNETYKSVIKKMSRTSYVHLIYVLHPGDLTWNILGSFLSYSMTDLWSKSYISSWSTSLDSFSRSSSISCTFKKDH